ncbi:uncharacterized protein LOC107361343 [Tetranychus urticae]|uniref:Alpha/beta hydrolase fold-3 domain-containing protein n=1 Tax=Tetranychus urticae TaxID=32264 RepID=T1K6V0_TETUR|nr:uncharacterized protein LOC107361343 [Tetranychus urticae]
MSFDQADCDCDNNNIDTFDTLGSDPFAIKGNHVHSEDDIIYDGLNENNNVVLIDSSSKLNPKETFFADVSQLFSQLDSHLKSISVNDKELESLLISLEVGFNQMLSISSHYEFKNLPANGYITYCVLVRSWLTKCMRQPKEGRDSYKNDYIVDFKIVIKGFLLVRDLLMHFHQTQLNTSQSKEEKSTDSSDGETVNKSLPIFSADIDETIFQLENFFDSTQFQEALTRSFNLFWLSPRTRSILKLYQKGASWTYVNFIKSWRVLTNKRYRSKTFIKFANRANLGFPVDMATIIDGHLARKVFRNLFFRHADAVGTNFWIPGQGRWIIPKSGPGIDEHNPPLCERPMIRCRLIRHRDKPLNSDVLIFHCHGSGFILSSPDIHDAYLKPWVARLDGVSVLSVDYSLMATYPRQFQDVLDAYLWVTSGDESVKEKIGFHPKKIVLIGDSAGSMLAIAVPLLLNVISAKNDPSVTILKPAAFVSFYGTFNLTGAWASSRVMTLFDPILHYGNVLAVAGCLSGIQGRIDDPKDRPKNRLMKMSSFIAEDIRLMKRALKPRDIEPWYLKDGKIDSARFHQLFNILQSPYLNVPTFHDFDYLKDMPICLISSFGCIFLDDNIALARAWKGPVEVHVLEGQVHGFLFMSHEKTAIEFSANKVVEIVNRVVKQTN